MSETRFQGVPVNELPIQAVDWTYRAEHIRTRSVRQPGDFDVEPAWATEAALDSDRLVDVASKGSVVVMGFSQLAGRVLKVWLVPKDDMEVSGEWWGASACVANETNTRDYRDQKEGRL
jgi:hypothetical protein